MKKFTHSDEAKKRIGDAAKKRNSAAIALKAWKEKALKICTVDGCDKPHKSKGYCNMHYIRWRKTGDISGAKPMVNTKGEANFITAYGYRQINGGLEHITVAQKALGRKLPNGAIVHHVNEDKLDNRPENLVICPDRAYHNLIHQRMRAMDVCGNPDWMQCRFCKQYDDPENMYVSPRQNAARHRECFNKYRRERAAS